MKKRFVLALLTAPFWYLWIRFGSELGDPASQQSGFLAASSADALLKAGALTLLTYAATFLVKWKDSEQQS